MNEESERVERFRFTNAREVNIEFILEPWGMSFALEPTATLEVFLRGPEGVLEVEYSDTDKVVLYGWSGCTIEVLKNGQEVYSTLTGLPVPEVPTGQSIRSFLKNLFGP